MLGFQTEIVLDFDSGEITRQSGNTKLCSNDRLTLVGSIGDIEIAKHRFSEA
jgi:Trk K+ transport system NAD-binding subunit